MTLGTALIALLSMLLFSIAKAVGTAMRIRSALWAMGDAKEVELTEKGDIKLKR